ncbi:HalOD1 output domain-containing protein [Natrialba taiwanensis]|uniref:Halobacterial output domain-containing protein n=1 Tax=Natrialba taiwanensis DSM 12281 TaxID=1230458 RepID=L9ZZ83_9EURY|nr:HalOD1 output domain-containing protein [Natrialba taiwanensis]ELY91830.1 hypothetical protein C484_10041 [Natrialba taiwanensis DSM 12281]
MTESDRYDAWCLSKRIVREVADFEGRDPADLPPLYEAIDPEALEMIFTRTEGGTMRTGKIDFLYAGHVVTIEYEDEPVIRIEQ